MFRSRSTVLLTIHNHTLYTVLILSLVLIHNNNKNLPKLYSHIDIDVISAQFIVTRETEKVLIDE